MDSSCRPLCCRDCADLKIKHSCHCHIKEDLPNLGILIDKQLTGIFYLRERGGKLRGIRMVFDESYEFSFIDGEVKLGPL